MPNPRKQLKQLIQREASEYTDTQPAWLGDYNEVVQTSTSGVLYARLINGKVIKVYNTFHVAPDFDQLVMIGRSRTLPSIWQIIRVRETYTVPSAGGRVEYHHEQHEFPQGDTVWIDRKQVLWFSVLVLDAAAFTVQVFGGYFTNAGGLAETNPEVLDLSSYVVTFGAKYVSIEVDDTGALSLHEGSNFGALDAGQITDVPVPDPGKGHVASVVFFEGQTTLLNEHIRVPMAISMVPKSTGLQIQDASADTPALGDLFGFWDIVDLELKSITYRDLLDLTKDADHTAHLHGLMRWNGAIGQTTFELPDVASQVESISLNGLEEDPLVYSLSADGTQIVLDSALASADTVTAHYILAMR